MHASPRVRKDREGDIRGSYDTVVVQTTSIVGRRLLRNCAYVLQCLRPDGAQVKLPGPYKQARHPAVPMAAADCPLLCTFMADVMMHLGLDKAMMAIDGHAEAPLN